jgi:hypothetical protein
MLSYARHLAFALFRKIRLPYVTEPGVEAGVKLMAMKNPWPSMNEALEIIVY